MTKRFFVADNDITYSFVATDIDHCKSLLAGSGVVFFTKDGEETYDIELADITWSEITAQDAATRFTVSDGGPPTDVYRCPLSERGLGDWFCSEW